MRSKKSFLQGALFGALIVLSGAGIVSCGVRLSKDVSSEEKVEALKKLIDEKYMGEVDEDALKEGLYKGYVQGLDDPYSVYYDEEETKELYETTEGEYSGIGAVLSQDLKSGVITLVQIYEDSPADKAGLKDEDILTKVGTLDVTGMDLSEVVTYIKGEKGTEVELTVLRGEDADEVTVTAVRDTVEAQTVEYEMLEDQIGYIALYEFTEQTESQYQAAFEDLESQGMERLIIDVRNNPGGLLTSVCDILEDILPEGLIVYTEDKDGNREEYTCSGENELEIPLAVLVNGNSASASEIFAGAIQDYGTGTIVGSTTFGKGIVQSLIPFTDGSAIKTTTAKYYTPSGRCIHGTGIEPDIAVELDEGLEQETSIPHEQDNQLQKAIETVKELG